MAEPLHTRAMIGVAFAPVKGPIDMVGLLLRKLISYHRKYRLYLLVGLAITVVGGAVETSARPLSVRVDRWLEMRNFSGTVEFLQNGRWNRAQRGQRLSNIGDGVRTGPGSLARLAVDTQIGFVSVSENTDLRITDLYTTPRGGKVTQLDVQRGQARIFVRPFTNPDSRLEIRTPAGVNGVRGTDFGIITQPGGRSALVVEEGRVTSSAQGESVSVDAGFQNIIIPGEPPSLPEPLSDDATFKIFRVERRNRQSGRSRTNVLLKGNTSPYNLLLIDDETQETDRDGNFDVLLPLPETELFNVKIITPLGTEKIYELVVP
ncbi:MAG: FecR domain-containing protein [Cyanobacteria bacterium P01_D01_bin.156]